MKKHELNRNKPFIYIFDLNEILIDRFPSRIAKALNNIEGDSEYNFVFLYAEKYDNKKANPVKIPRNSILYFDPKLSIDGLENLIAKYPPSAYIGIGLRLPDLYLFSFFNKKNIFTYMVQHGLFINHLSRIGFARLVYDKYVKFLKYLNYCRNLSKIIDKPTLRILMEMYDYFLKGTKKLPELDILSSSLLIPNIAFTYDSSWDNYFIKTYGFSKSNFVYIGNPDYDLAIDCINSPGEFAICYICQSLVEDGRYSTENYVSFLKSMKRELSEFKVYIKLHPRSNLELYKTFEGTNNFILTRKFENCMNYMGHYSSVLKVAHELNRNVLLYDLKDHGVPEYYAKLASIQSDNFKEIAQFISSNRIIESSPKTELLSYINSNNSPFQNIAKVVKSNLKLR